jgi:hypothetical protein
VGVKRQGRAFFSRPVNRFVLRDLSVVGDPADPNGSWAGVGEPFSERSRGSQLADPP